MERDYKRELHEIATAIKFGYDELITNEQKDKLSSFLKKVLSNEILILDTEKLKKDINLSPVSLNKFLLLPNPYCIEGLFKFTTQTCFNSEVAKNLTDKEFAEDFNSYIKDKFIEEMKSKYEYRDKE